jgi:hypothetical protein
VDFVIDSDAVQAVSRVASWRRCSHILAPRSADASVSPLCNLPASVSVLTIPDAVSLDLPNRIRSSQRMAPWSRRQGNDLTPTVEHA